MGKSLMSKIIEKAISKAAAKYMGTDRQSYERSLREMLNHAEPPYRLNYKRFSVDVKEKVSDGMVCYVLNSENKTNVNKAMYFHGGAYVYQPNLDHWRFLNKLSKSTGTEIWVPVYPKIPFHDADFAYKSLMRLYGEFSGTVEEGKVILMGDSSGGGLVLGLAQRIRDMRGKQPADLVMISPWLDVSVSSPEINEIAPRDKILYPDTLRVCGEFWAGGRDLKDPAVSPLYGDLEGLGRMTVFIGTNDILYADAHALSKKAKECGISVDFNEKEGMAHVYPLWPIPEAKEAFRKLAGILAEK